MPYFSVTNKPCSGSHLSLLITAALVPASAGILLMPLLTGLIVGVLMYIPIGPINLWVINTRLRRGTACAIVLGSRLMDVLFFVTLFSGIALLPHQY